MKKVAFLITIIISSVLGIIFFNPIKAFVLPEGPVAKEVNLNIGTEKRYALPVYANAIADVQITITKWHGNKSTKIWEKTLNDIHLNENAGFDKVEAQTVTLPVYANKDRIVVKYLVTYKDKGSVVELAYYSEISKGSKGDSVDVII
ncbi:MAG: hypothetical protein ABIY35_02465 [Chitinophagaceae bacterium]